MNIQIIGAGIMGRGIAQVCVTHGFETILVDIDSDILREAEEEITKRLTREVEKGRLSSENMSKSKENLLTTTNWKDNIETTDVIIECVPEKPELKKRLIRDIHLENDCIIASNTSSISIDDLALASDRPENVIGMHFFNPAPVMKLVEIVIGKATRKDVVTEITKLTENLGKEPIKVKDSPGFASSRLGVALGLEAIRMVEQDVASPEDIDKAMTLGYRHPMGPLELTDYVGLDTRLKIAEYLNGSGISPAFEIPDLLRKKVENNQLGRKTGKGFYTWEDGKKI